MNGSAYTKNTIYYAYKGNRPDHFYEKPKSREKVSVWVGLCGDGGLIGPYFFQGNVNGASYLEMLNNYVIPELSFTLSIRFQ